MSSPVTSGPPAAEICNYRKDTSTERPEQQGLESRLRLAAQGAAIFTILIYFVGFLVVSLHHAQFGITQSNLLRARILSAGILFCVFLAIPLLETAALRGVWGLGEPISNFGDPARDAFVRPLVQVLSFVASSIGAAFFVRLFLIDGPSFVGYLAMLAAGGVLLGAIALLRPFRNKRAAWSIVVLLCGLALMCVCVWIAHDRGFQYLVIWFCMCGLMVKGLHNLKDTEMRKRFQLHSLVVNVLVVIGFFGILIYPRIAPALGGGRVIPATLQFAERANPLGNTSQVKIWLVDETDSGFYVLQSKDAKKAVFVPRNSVIAIFFGDEDSGRWF